MIRTKLRLAGSAAIACLLTVGPAAAQDAVVYVVEEVDLGDTLGTLDIYIPVLVDTGLARELASHGDPGATSLHGQGAGSLALLDAEGDARAAPTDTTGDAHDGATLGNSPYGYATPVTRDW